MPNNVIARRQNEERRTKYLLPRQRKFGYANIGLVRRKTDGADRGATHAKTVKSVRGLTPTDIEPLYLLIHHKEAQQMRILSSSGLLNHIPIHPLIHPAHAGAQLLAIFSFSPHGKISLL